MSNETANKDVINAIVSAWQAGYTIYYSMFGTVKETTQDPDVDKPGLLTANVNGQTIEKVRWHYPMKPAKDSKCVVMFCENKPGQKFAFGFDLIEEIKTKVGADIDLHLKAGKITVSCKELDLTMNNTSIKSDGNVVKINDNLEVSV
jgi:hypothetical protein